MFLSSMRNIARGQITISKLTPMIIGCGFKPNYRIHHHYRFISNIKPLRNTSNIITYDKQTCESQKPDLENHVVLPTIPYNINISDDLYKQMYNCEIDFLAELEFAIYDAYYTDTVTGREISMLPKHRRVDIINLLNHEINYINNIINKQKHLSDIIESDDKNQYLYAFPVLLGICINSYAMAIFPTIIMYIYNVTKVNNNINKLKHNVDVTNYTKVTIMLQCVINKLSNINSVDYDKYKTYNIYINGGSINTNSLIRKK